MIQRFYKDAIMGAKVNWIIFIGHHLLNSMAGVIALASGGKYQADHVLMIGEALGDMKAARANKALFFPINPGYE